MSSIRELYDQFTGLIGKVEAGNETWQFIASIAILVVGFFLLEVAWRLSNRRVSEVLENKGYQRWVPYVAGFLPSLRLVFAALLLRGAEVPLIIPPKLVVLFHGVQAFLLSLAMIFFLFHLVEFLDLIHAQIPERMRKQFSEQGLKNLKSLLRITSVVAAVLFFIHTQKSFFPQWLWESSVWRYLAVVLVFAVLYMGGRLLTTFHETMTVSLRDSVEKTRLRLVLRASLWPMRLLLVAIAVYAFQEILSLPSPVDRVAETMVNILGTIVVALFLYQLLDVVEYELTKFVRRDDNEFDMNFVQMVRIIAKVLIVIFGIIYLLKAATGKPMTTLLAGLGIGGLAVALAAQDTLKNLFGSFMLMIDKPFVVGDWVRIEGEHATVEEIGLRSTRIRTFSGHVIAIPNEKMASMSIENVQVRPFIRRRMNVTITYDTPPDKVEKAVALIRDILADRPELVPDRPPKVHFNDFNDTSLNILVSYWFRHNDFWASVAFDEMVNFQIMRAFEAEGIEFAFPTTTTYLAQDNRRPLSISLSPHSPPDKGTEESA
ncbi:MAG TPA: mechanosensitive ion channel family protein [Deltaproteobacteria bacterium]|nr:mechanosensitive ion channel family protein [Deltaproteobacteria bacterium]